MTPDIATVEAYIRQKAAQLGINPDVAVRVAKSEGLKSGVWQSNVVKNGRREPSYGPFQLFEGGGLGNEFKDKYGVSASDPSTWMDQVNFALGKAKEGGWTPWYGARDTGIGKWEGIKGTLATAAEPPPPAQIPTVGPNRGLGGNDAPQAYDPLTSIAAPAYSPSQGPGEAVSASPLDYLTANAKNLQGFGAGLSAAGQPQQEALPVSRAGFRRMEPLQIEPTTYVRRKKPSIMDLIAEGGY